MLHITLPDMIALLMAALFMGMYLRPLGDAAITHTLDRVLAMGVPTPLTHLTHRVRAAIKQARAVPVPMHTHTVAPVVCSSGCRGSCMH